MNKIIRYGIIAVAVLSVAIAYGIYVKVQRAAQVPSGPGGIFVEIPTNSTFEEVVDILKAKQVLHDEDTFRLLAQQMKYARNPMRAGRYELQPGWGTLKVIRHLRGGGQAPSVVVLNVEREPENVAAKAARFLEPDSVDMVTLFQDPAFLEEIGYTRETLMTLFIPNSYELYWNTTPRQFVERMVKEHKKFWDKDGRRAKAEALGLSPAQVYTLASIVEKETLQNSEKRRIAGVYLNRLKTNMLLQADPTSVFATRDFYIKQVTYYHTGFDSPYNTYKYKGLPPGPITMPSISSIDAVLNYEEHEFIFFCAIGDESGLHAFAKTLEAHNQNAQRYRENLRQRGLR